MGICKGNHITKHPPDITIHPPEWPTLKRLMTLNIGKDVELSYFVDVEVCNSPTTLENILAVSYKSKHTLPCDPVISLLVSYTREMKHIHKKMKKKIHDIFICNVH